MKRVVMPHLLIYYSATRCPCKPHSLLGTVCILAGRRDKAETQPEKKVDFFFLCQGFGQ